jgi:hypothetical protein
LDIVVKILLEKGADIEALGPDGTTPLCSACSQGIEHRIRLFLAMGADPDAPGKDGSTPLWIASKNGHGKVVTLLLDCDANVNIVGPDGTTPLMVALEYGHASVARILLHGGASLVSQDNIGAIPIWIAATRSDLLNIIVEFVGSYAFEEQNEIFLSLSYEAQRRIASKLELFDKFRRIAAAPVEFLSNLMMRSLPIVIQHDGTVTTLSESEHKFVFTDNLDDDNLHVLTIVLSKYHKYAGHLANTFDRRGRRAVDIAEPRCKAAFMRHIYFLGKFKFIEGPPEHQSETSSVYFGHEVSIDAVHGEEKTSARLALKFMKHREQFDREVQLRKVHSLHDNYVVQEIGCYDGDNDEDFQAELDALNIGDYRYLLVMPAAERNLHDIMTHENIGGKNWKLIIHMLTDIVGCLEHLHSKGLIHGDLKRK